MFGRRRRTPLLGAAVIAGTATAASRHGAKKQAQVESERQYQMEQEAEIRRYAEENERLRNQRAIDQAVNDAMSKQQAENMAKQPVSPGGPMNNMQSSAAMSPTYGSNDILHSPANSLPSPMYQQAGMAPSLMPRGNAAAEGMRFCSDCGNKCTPQDKFCSGCGHAMMRAMNENISM
ncbi:hypothetical protein RJ55_04847 [Drechmeria coniospora]|nr:hypothetical protein RJ55_04847 [Drechmeria coniospora]